MNDDRSRGRKLADERKFTFGGKAPLPKPVASGLDKWWVWTLLAVVAVAILWFASQGVLQ